MSSETPGGSFIRTDVPMMKRPKLPFDQERSLLKGYRHGTNHMKGGSITKSLV